MGSLALPTGPATPLTRRLESITTLYTDTLRSMRVAVSVCILCNSYVYDNVTVALHTTTLPL